MSDDSKIVVTLKADGNAPWIVVRGDTPEETSALLNSIGETGLIGTVVIAQQELHGVFAANVGVGATPTQVVTTPQAPPTSPAPSTPVAPAQAAPTSGRRDTDKWGRTYTEGVANAPMSPFGPAVLKDAKNREGKPYQQWIDPRLKEIPWNYAAGVRSDPADKWAGEFVR